MGYAVMPYANGEAIGFYMAIAFTASIKTLDTNYPLFTTSKQKGLEGFYFACKVDAI